MFDHMELNEESHQRSIETLLRPRCKAVALVRWPHCSVRGKCPSAATEKVEDTVARGHPRYRSTGFDDHITEQYMIGIGDWESGIP